MDSCDVLVVGGGPAGSTCAGRLVRAGLDVVVIDKSSFPRDKVCAGWITPEVVRLLELDLPAYAKGRTLQPFTGFRTSTFTGEPRLTDFGRVISYGIRRCEFDAYLLERAAARRVTSQPVTSFRRDGSTWIVNDTIRTRIIVGAGGHFCPVARWLNPRDGSESVVVAQEVEVPLEDDQDDHIPAEAPELMFWSDLMGYGWCVRKGGYLNLGVGRLTSKQFPAAVKEFSERLVGRGIITAGAAPKWKGHAYLLNRTSTRRISGDGVLLAGDAAGLALAPSGEGILAAVESGAMAAEVISTARARPSIDSLDAYPARIAARFGPRASGRAPGVALPHALLNAAGKLLLRSPWLTRRYLLEDWFLHMRRPGLTT